MARIGLLLTSLLLLMGGVVAVAAAQTVPTKTITFYNNSADRTLFPVIQAPIMNGADVRDLWLQAQFQVTNVSTQIFNTTLLYKIYVNRNGGVPPKSSVTLTIPFYTQLLDQPGQPRQGERPVHRLVERHAGLRVRRQGRSGCGV